MKKHALLDVIRGGRCTVLGYGVSNRPLVEWLLRHGAGAVTVRDGKSLSDMETGGDKAALDALGSISGRVDTEDILTRVFATFCLGK